MADDLNARVDPLEETMQRAFASIHALAEKQAKLDDLAVLLVEAQVKTEERFRETDQRFKETDARIDKLVSAIGEFIRISANRQLTPRTSTPARSSCSASKPYHRH